MSRRGGRDEAPRGGGGGGGGVLLVRKDGRASASDEIWAEGVLGLAPRYASGTILGGCGHMQGYGYDAVAWPPESTFVKHIRRAPPIRLRPPLHPARAQVGRRACP